MGEGCTPVIPAIRRSQEFKVSYGLPLPTSAPGDSTPKNKPKSRYPRTRLKKKKKKGLSKHNPFRLSGEFRSGTRCGSTAQPGHTSAGRGPALLGRSHEWRAEPALSMRTAEPSHGGRQQHCACPCAPAAVPARSSTSAPGRRGRRGAVGGGNARPSSHCGAGLSLISRGRKSVPFRLLTLVGGLVVTLEWLLVACAPLAL